MQPALRGRPRPRLPRFGQLATGDDLRPLLSRLAEHCFKAGIPEEEVVRQTLMHYYREADEPLVRLTLHNLYGELKGFGTRSSLNKDQETAFRLEEFMKRRYEFRYNTVLGDLEYRQRDSIHFYFQLPTSAYAAASP